MIGKSCYDITMSAIGSLNETDLHEQLKLTYAGEDGRTECMVGSFVVDVVRGEDLIEIQTRGFARLRRKLTSLSPTHRIRIVHPIATETMITRLNTSGEITSSRRSPRKGRFEEVYRELSAIADLLPDPNIVIEAVMVRVAETRVDDGNGSWRRRGVSIVARQLGSIDETHRLVTSADYLRVLPRTLPAEFTNGDLIRESGLPYRHVQPITAALRKMALIRITGKRGREQLYEIVSRRSSGRKAARRVASTRCAGASNAE